MYAEDKTANILKVISLSLMSDAGFTHDKTGKPILFKREMGVESVVYPIDMRLTTPDIIMQNMNRVIDVLMYTPQAKHTFFYYLCIGDGESINEYKSALTDKVNECSEKGILCEVVFVSLENLSFNTITGRKVIDRKIRKVLEKNMDNLRVSNPEETLQEKAKEYVKLQEEMKPYQKVQWINPATILILINIFIFLIDVLLLLRTNVEPLKLFGIQDNQLIKSGEVWRLFTSMFLHADMAHLFGNMLTLFYFGNIILPHLSKKKFLVLYFISGFVGNILSFFFTTYRSLGASGCIMGVGGYLIYSMFFSKKGYLFRKRGNYFIFAYMVVFNLMYGLFVEGIDNYGHFGGFFAGIIIAWIYASSNKDKPRA